MWDQETLWVVAGAGNLPSYSLAQRWDQPVSDGAPGTVFTERTAGLTPAGRSADLNNDH